MALRSGPRLTNRQFFGRASAETGRQIWGSYYRCPPAALSPRSSRLSNWFWRRAAGFMPRSGAFREAFTSVGPLLPPRKKTRETGQHEALSTHH